jgi:ATP/maltotriose-dependent transcriptional regulator MalT
MVGHDIETPQADRLSAGQSFLDQGDWEEARACFEAALVEKESPEALEGLSMAAWWLDDAETVFHARERSYRLYRERDDRRGAARMAIWLSSDYLDFRGEAAIASGWRQRARRLLDGLELTPEHGWLALHEGTVALEVKDDTVAAKRYAAEVTEVGRCLGVADLEMMGMAVEGLALVTEGLVDEGMRLLDEASAATAGGELQERFSVAWVSCYLIYACERVRDFDRAAQWCKRMEELYERLRFRLLLGQCRTHYAGVLIWRGAWEEADAELTRATEVLQAARPPSAAEGLVRLAELRRRQGMFDQAAQLFARAEGHPLALLGAAELALDLGKPRDARHLLERLLRHLPPENKTQRVDALEVLVHVQTALGDHEQAVEALQALQTISDIVGTDPLRAAASLSAGIVALAGGDFREAQRKFEDAIDLYQRSGAPFETAIARAELAQVQFALGELAEAEKEARAAVSAFQSIGASHEAKKIVTLLRQLEQGPLERRAGGSRAAFGLTRRELEVLRLVAQGLSDKEIATALDLSEHTVHRHVSNILANLGLSSRAAAVAYAARHGAL